MTPYVVGIDLSLTATGVAVWDVALPGTVPLLLLETVVPAPRLDGLRRLRSVRSEVTARVRGADLVVLEGLYPQRQANAYSNERAGLWWLVVDRLDALAVPYAVVQPSAVKVYATGKGGGKGLTKVSVAVAAAKRYDVSPQDDNQADACILSCMGLHHLGCPPAPVPATHERALKAVVWP